MKKNIEKLPNNFIGIGEVKGFKFNQVYSDKDYYIYRVDNLHTVRYEVFKKRVTAKLISWEERKYSDKDFKEVYPKAKDFGIWAWCCGTLEQAKRQIR